VGDFVRGREGEGEKSSLDLGIWFVVGKFNGLYLEVKNEYIC